MNGQQQGPTLGEALDEACLALGHAVLDGRLRDKAHAEEVARLTAERDDLLHRADHAPDPTV